MKDANSADRNSDSMANKSSIIGARRGILLIPAAIGVALLALAPGARAVNPPPGGGYANNNTAVGTTALQSLTTGGDNTALGFAALFMNGAGDSNTATGFGALYHNTTGSSNTATGNQALNLNTTASNNTATGQAALFGNTTGGFNTATGAFALENNTTGNDNTATGANALLNNISGGDNVATGIGALQGNTTGAFNTANGNGALFTNTTGNSNTATGIAALIDNTTGSSNIAVGEGAGSQLTTGSNNIDIGNQGVAGESNTIRIGTAGTQRAAFVGGIFGASVPSGVGVIVGPNGRLGTVKSSERFKEAIKPMGKASEAILALKPVTFRYKRKLDPDGIPQFGLVAEQVEKISPALVARDIQGKVVTVRYEAVNAMLLNEFLKEHHEFLKGQRNVQELEAAIAQQRKEIKALVISLKVRPPQIREASLK